MWYSREVITTEELYARVSKGISCRSCRMSRDKYPGPEWLNTFVDYLQEAQRLEVPRLSLQEFKLIYQKENQ